MSETTDDQIEAEARAMVRRMIEESGWYPKLRGEFRQARIDQDIERMWHLMIGDARKRLEQGFRQSRGG
jgi:chemotaxis regulatin CheY-phosphate phosphatase CheZ